ncbi:hypothetical protein [Lactobacillus johnsonii]|uniref:Uncharacterized protein n=1 Tax=Lactobacillus johnsonii TaxID=33959 RepID=A0A921ELP4_LACJH|nr:hypothetical protein [Lactobacillus johnsonii]MCI6762522.1 hypothetical protein [Lactobacillus johnsonii]HJE49946.1 hypothetical protein [Lactobacillus johnsonii]
MKQDRLKQELKKYLNSKLTYPLQTVEDISIESILKVYGSQKPSDYVIQLVITGKVDNRTIRKDK